LTAAAQITSLLSELTVTDKNAPAGRKNIDPVSNEADRQKIQDDQKGFHFSEQSTY